MPERNISSAEATDNATDFTDYSVTQETTDGPSDQTETTWQNTDWEQWLAYYLKIPELRRVIDAKATWTVGKGWTSEDDTTTQLLQTIDGFGKDTFNHIMENMIRQMEIGGDAYAEIIRDDEDILVNLKPLDPGSMKHVVNGQGRIIRFEQVSKTAGKVAKRFEPEDIFYLARNRVADEIHGRSITEALAETILMINESMTDWKRVLHWNVDPLFIYHMDTDDATVIAAYKAKQDAARGKGEGIYVPKGAIVPELVSVAGNANLNPLPWLDMLKDKFYEESGVPKFIVGGIGGITEAAVKIAYLAFQQTIEEEQLSLEEQILAQLNLEVTFTFPASLENELISDNAKDEENGVSQPNDTTAELEGER